MSEPDTSGSGRELGSGLRRAADAASPRPIDVDAVLAASRRRRRARRTAIIGVTGAAAVLIAAGGVAFGLGGLGPNTASDSALTSETAADTAPEAGPEAAAGDASGLSLAPSEMVNLCGAPVAAATDATSSGLIVSVEPPSMLAPGATGEARITVTNAGSSAVAGEMRVVPALTLAEDGITVWHTNGVAADGLEPVSLAPGESIELRGAMTAVACSDADEPSEAFSEGLPALAPGEYAASAVVMFIASQSGAIEYLVAPLVPLSVE